MKKNILILAIFLASCTPTQQVTVTREMTVTFIPPTATATVIPTPTASPAFLTMQETIAKTDNFTLMGNGNIEGKLPDGTIGVIKGIRLNPDGTNYTIMVDGTEVTIPASDVTITDEGGVKVGGYHDRDRDGNFAKITTYTLDQLAGMNAEELEAVYKTVDKVSPEGYVNGGVVEGQNNFVKFYDPETGKLMSMYDLITGDYVSPELAGLVLDPVKGWIEAGVKWSGEMVTLVNGKGENITIPDCQKDFDACITYIAKNANWVSGDRNALNHAFAIDAKLIEFLAQFDGVAGWRPDLWAVKNLPKRGLSESQEFFLTHNGAIGNKTLITFQRSDLSFEAVMFDMKTEKALIVEGTAPVMETLLP